MKFNTIQNLIRKRYIKGSGLVKIIFLLILFFFIFIVGSYFLSFISTSLLWVSDGFQDGIMFKDQQDIQAAVSAINVDIFNLTGTQSSLIPPISKPQQPPTSQTEYDNIKSNIHLNINIINEKLTSLKLIYNYTNDYSIITDAIDFFLDPGFSSSIDENLKYNINYPSSRDLGCDNLIIFTTRVINLLPPSQTLITLNDSLNNVVIEIFNLTGVQPSKISHVNEPQNKPTSQKEFDDSKSYIQTDITTIIEVLNTLKTNYNSKTSEYNLITNMINDIQIYSEYIHTQLNYTCTGSNYTEQLLHGIQVNTDIFIYDVIQIIKLLPSTPPPPKTRPTKKPKLPSPPPPSQTKYPPPPPPTTKGP